MNTEKNLHKCFYSEDLNRRKGDRRASGLNICFEEFKKITHLQLIHSTTSVFLDNILENGLLPSSATGNEIEDNLSTDLECIYLSAAFDYHYIKRAVEKYGGEGIVVLVEVEKALLEADENSISQDNLQGQILLNEKLLYDSLSFIFGACKYRGIISPENIVSVFSKEGTRLNKKEIAEP